MTVKELSLKGELTPIVLLDENREIDGVYCGDLLSWVMGKAQSDNVWITIMTNINVVAVASLSDVSCVILAEGVEMDADALKAARDKGINILSTQKSSYETALLLGKLI